MISLPAVDSERPQEYVADVSFDELDLSPELRKAIAERGYTSPTPVQAKAYPLVKAGRDLIVRSKTGTGKTAAFGMPIIDSIPAGTRQVTALMMCPTRELALQVSQELTALSKYRDIKVAAIYGGASMQQQIDALQGGAAIVVGTPGRIFDHIRRGNLKLSTCTHVVLDEADEMLNQGFYEEVCRILDGLPSTRQVLLFSATVPEDIQKLIARYTTNAETLLLSGDVFTVDHITHYRYDVSDAYPKPRNLLYLLEMETPEAAIVFCNTKDDTELVSAVLNRHGFDAAVLNGDLPQKERERVMNRVKRGELAFMVATDLAARGIDISDLGYVINYSLPEDPAVYLHRVGRTGRIGKKGIALNLVSGRELGSLSALEKKFNVRFVEKAMPKAEEAAVMWAQRHVREIQEAAEGTIFEGYLSLAQQIRARADADANIAFLLKYFFSHRRLDEARRRGNEVPVSAASPGAAKPAKSESGARGKSESRSETGRGKRGEPKRNRFEREFDSAPPSAAPSGPKRSDRALFESAPSAEAPVAFPPAIAPQKSKPSGDRALFEGQASVPQSSDTVVEQSPKRRPERTKRQETPVPEGQVRIWLSLGKLSIEESALRELLSSHGAPIAHLQRVELRSGYSYLFVDEAQAEAFETLRLNYQDKPVKIERAKPPAVRG